VYAFGGTGDRLRVKRAFNTSDSTSAQTVGLVLSTSIGVNQKGFIVVSGLLDGLSILPTSTWADGDPVYLGATAGTITNVKPSAPNHLVYIGFVTTASNGSAGRLYVRVQNGYEMDEIHDVAISSPTNGQTLTYESATSLWKNTTPAGGGLTVGTTAIASGTIGRILFQNGSNVLAQDSALFWDNTNKRLGIGATPATTVRLDVRAQGALSTDIALRVRNSADTRSNLTVNGLGQTRLLSNSFSGNFFTISYVADNSVERDAFIFTQNVQNAMGQAWTFDAGYNGVQERLTISNNLTGNNQGIFSIHASNFCFGTTILNSDNTADRRVLRIATGVAPTTSFTDGFKFYSADIVAGNAAPHFRTENGSIIKLFQGAALTAEDGTLANAVTRIAELETRLKAHGLIA
jgi:hypothetical protein